MSKLANILRLAVVAIFFNALLTTGPAYAYDSSNGILANFGIAEFLLVIIWLVFTALAFVTREVYVFGVASVVSIIFGMDVGLFYIKDTVNNWALGVVGFALVFFGLFLLVLAARRPMQGGKK